MACKVEREITVDWAPVSNIAETGTPSMRTSTYTRLPTAPARFSEAVIALV